MIKDTAHKQSILDLAISKAHGTTRGHYLSRIGYLLSMAEKGGLLVDGEAWAFSSVNRLITETTNQNYHSGYYNLQEMQKDGLISMRMMRRIDGRFSRPQMHYQVHDPVTIEAYNLKTQKAHIILGDSTNEAEQIMVSGGIPEQVDTNPRLSTPKLDLPHLDTSHNVKGDVSTYHNRGDSDVSENIAKPKNESMFGGQKVDEGSMFGGPKHITSTYQCKTSIQEEREEKDPLITSTLLEDGKPTVFVDSIKNRSRPQTDTFTPDLFSGAANSSNNGIQIVREESKSIVGTIGEKSAKESHVALRIENRADSAVNEETAELIPSNEKVREKKSKKLEVVPTDPFEIRRREIMLEVEGIMQPEAKLWQFGFQRKYIYIMIDRLYDEFDLTKGDIEKSRVFLLCMVKAYHALTHGEQFITAIDDPKFWGQQQYTASALGSERMFLKILTLTLERQRIDKEKAVFWDEYEKERAVWDAGEKDRDKAEAECVTRTVFRYEWGYRETVRVLTEAKKRGECYSKYRLYNNHMLSFEVEMYWKRLVRDGLIEDGMEEHPDRSDRLTWQKSAVSFKSFTDPFEKDYVAACNARGWSFERPIHAEFTMGMSLWNRARLEWDERISRMRKYEKKWSESCDMRIL